jgi:hypothetical protein
MPGSIQPLFPKVLVVSYELLVTTEANRPVRQILRWNDPEVLISQFIDDLKYASYGFCNYQVVDRVSVSGFPIKEDGFRYSGSDYMRSWRSRTGFHSPDWADYHRIMVDLNIAGRIDDHEIDEIWMFAGPYAGFYESRMAGPSAFWCNAPPIDRFSQMNRRTVLMGFNYERGVGEMLESYGHRAESIMEHVYRRRRGEDNLWRRFIRYDKSHPGQAEVGNVHYAPNSQRDYDWGNPQRVLSRCDTWLNFPDLTGAPRMVNSRDWGNGDTRLHHLWWLRHFPRKAGESGGVSNNWWQYVVDPNRVR